MAQRATKYTYRVDARDFAHEPCQVTLQPGSFARGGMRKAYYCTEQFADGSRQACVAKFSTTHRGDAAKVRPWSCRHSHESHGV